ncbi:uncharacterized protein LOC6576502 [Drosophila mojavensis]|uniref:Uncharacterized protein n=1 Tax=Drosophila mojavensis TaxID=7230 RepID=B4KEW4_DROMO|nr:uncharacterized protein LOC6576502 [Drosophila mojavensis]EDW11933.1 uncharacterized protein Dmoj_GI12451 [Drosophila mojavensis]
MNPDCETDIYSLECQEWMSLVCDRCRDLFAEAAKDIWAAWWHDTTPPLYKDVADMTVYDCEKLKHLLEVQVAASSPHKATVEYKEFAWWQKIALIIIYISILVLLLVVCRRWRRTCKADNLPPIHNEQEDLLLPTSSSKPDHPPAEQCKPDETGAIPRECLRPLKKHGFKAWMQQICRPIFIHNEGALKRRQKKYEEDKKLERILNERNIKKWTKARTRAERRREMELESMEMMEFKQTSRK